MIKLQDTIDASKILSKYLSGFSPVMAARGRSGTFKSATVWPVVAIPSSKAWPRSELLLWQILINAGTFDF